MEKSKLDVKVAKITGTDQLDVLRLKYAGKDKIGIMYNVDKVIIIPYTEDDSHILNEIGILHEFNPLRDGYYNDTLVTETMESDDDNTLVTAIRGLEEETGYRVIDESRWNYLGTLMLSKIIDIEHACYAVNVTGMSPSKTIPDGKVEELATFKLIPMSNVIRSNDAYILSLMMKLYVFKFGKTFINDID